MKRQFRASTPKAAPGTPSSRIVVVSAEELRTMVSEAVAEQMADFVEDARQTVPLLDRRGLAAVFGCCTDTIDRLRAEGMPTVLVSEAVRFERAACLAWLKSR